MSTTRAATRLALSAPTLSAHLQSLRAAGLLASRRDGRQVLYARTELATGCWPGPTATAHTRTEEKHLDQGGLGNPVYASTRRLVCVSCDRVLAGMHLSRVG